MMDVIPDILDRIGDFAAIHAPKYVGPLQVMRAVASVGPSAAPNNMIDLTAMAVLGYLAGREEADRGQAE